MSQLKNIIINLWEKQVLRSQQSWGSFLTCLCCVSPSPAHPYCFFFCFSRMTEFPSCISLGKQQHLGWSVVMNVLLGRSVSMCLSLSWLLLPRWKAYRVVAVSSLYLATCLGFYPPCYWFACEGKKKQTHFSPPVVFQIWLKLVLAGHTSLLCWKTSACSYVAPSHLEFY